MAVWRCDSDSGMNNKMRMFEKNRLKDHHSANIEWLRIQFRNKTKDTKQLAMRMESKTTYYALFCHQFDLMTQFGWMSMDPDPNLIHFRVPFCANAVVDSSNSVQFDNPYRTQHKNRNKQYHEQTFIVHFFDISFFQINKKVY